MSRLRTSPRPHGATTAAASPTAAAPADHPAATPRPRQDPIVQPHPEVPQHQRDPHVQQPQQRVARRGPDPPLVHLAVARLDPEPQPVGLKHRVGRRRTEAPEGVDQAPAARAASTAPGSCGTSRRSRPSRCGAWRRAGCSRTNRSSSRSGRRSCRWGRRVVGRAAVADHRHQERVPRRLEVADHRHAVEAAIEQQQAGPDADAGGLPQQALDHVLQRFALRTAVRATV